MPPHAESQGSQPLIVALTGNIASGKSAVADRLAARGAVIIDADVLAREAVEPGSEGLAEIVQRWGPKVLSPDGSLSRPTLRRLVFGDQDALNALNAIVHPRVDALRQQRITQARASGARIVVCDIPLLFEAGLDAEFDTIVLVDAPESVRRDRLVQRRGLSHTEAEAMMRAQMDAEVKRQRAQYVIDNDGTFAELDARVAALWAWLAHRANAVFS
jgi:dephospho-CoA kinase